MHVTKYRLVRLINFTNQKNGHDTIPHRLRLVSVVTYQPLEPGILDWSGVLWNMILVEIRGYGDEKAFSLFPQLVYTMTSPE